MEINEKKSVQMCLIEGKTIRYNMKCWRCLSKKQQIIAYIIIKVIANEKEIIKTDLRPKVVKLFNIYRDNLIDKYKKNYGENFINEIKNSKYDYWIYRKGPCSGKVYFLLVELTNKVYQPIPDFLVPVFVNIKTEHRGNKRGLSYVYTLTDKGKKLWLIWEKIVEC